MQYMGLGKCLNIKKEYLFSKDKDLTLNPQHTCLRKKSGTAVLTWNCSTGRWRQRACWPASQTENSNCRFIRRHCFRAKGWRGIKEELRCLVLAFVCVCKSIRARVLQEIEIKTVSSTKKINVLLKSPSKQNCLCYLDKNVYGFLWWSPSVAKRSSLVKG